MDLLICADVPWLLVSCTNQTFNHTPHNAVIKVLDVLTFLERKYNFTAQQFL